LRGESLAAAQRSDASSSEITNARSRAEAGNLHYCQVLEVDGPESPSQADLAQAWNCLEQQMALVPAGEVTLEANILAAPDANLEDFQTPLRRMRVRSIYIDRHAVTNAQFYEFVTAGGYRRSDLWPAQILPQVLQFVDGSDRAGPRFWSNGRPPQDKLDHPVVGISWYEANAYARWLGKRLPTPAEWQRAACWSDGGGSERRYPWGNAFDPRHANTWLDGPGDTVSVTEYYDGCTANGIYQLIGNVWEWVAAMFEISCQQEGAHVLIDQPMGEIRGGAFDSYFPTQTTSQFRSGQPLRYRGANVGFRCCVSADELTARPDTLDPINGDLGL
jgi:iron(II)-dependent oxidoreductase